MWYYYNMRKKEPTPEKKDSWFNSAFWTNVLNRTSATKYRFPYYRALPQFISLWGILMHLEHRKVVTAYGVKFPFQSAPDAHALDLVFKSLPSSCVCCIGRTLRNPCWALDRWQGLNKYRGATSTSSTRNFEPLACKIIATTSATKSQKL